MKESVLASSYGFFELLSDANATGADLHIRFPCAAELVIMGRESTYLQSGCTLAELSQAAVEELELTTLPECPEIISALQGMGRELSELLWMLAYSQAEDFHRQQCKKTDVYQLISWPNLTRLPHKESFVNIASLLMHRAHSCKIVSSMLRIPLDEVFLFCSCATAAGYLQTATASAQDDSLQVLPERKSSLISSILSRLQS
jgi:hypothetical protein